MRLSHQTNLSQRPGSSLGSREHGYLLVTFALLLVPLLLMVGLSVDVGSWYNRASSIQKAADAASLAGVVWLPDVATAKSYAREAAERNGFKDGVDGVTITIEPVVGQNRRLRVTIKDASVDSFFYSNIGGRSIDLQRVGTAEYVLPVPLGSPENRFGGNAQSDPSVPAASQPNLWGNIHGVRTDNYKGDAYAPACRGADNCTTTTNTAYRTSGYLYTIDVPAGVTDMDMQVWDAGLYPRNAETTDTGDTDYKAGNGSTGTTWTFYNKDSSELDVTDNPTAAAAGICTSGVGTWTLAQNTGATTYKNLWASICKRSGAVPAGRYLLRVQTTGNGSAANRYALRVLASSAVKPRIAAYGDMSMYNNVAAGNALFYLAEVAPVHKGKTLELNLYDPGEVSKVAGTTGNGTIQIIAPSGAVATTCGATATAPATIAATLSPCQFQSASGGTAKFNGSWVSLQIPIPNNYNCTLGQTGATGCWWKIKYIIDGQGNDTTTWAAQVIGDPVHLVEE